MQPIVAEGCQSVVEVYRDVYGLRLLESRAILAGNEAAIVEDVTA